MLCWSDGHWSSSSSSMPQRRRQQLRERALLVRRRRRRQTWRLSNELVKVAVAVSRDLGGYGRFFTTALQRGIAIHEVIQCLRHRHLPEHSIRAPAAQSCLPNRDPQAEQGVCCGPCARFTSDLLQRHLVMTTCWQSLWCLQVNVQARRKSMSWLMIGSAFGTRTRGVCLRELHPLWNRMLLLRLDVCDLVITHGFLGWKAATMRITLCATA
mmetsp:Transcript_96233/g.170473  ORF Transcript_96233/g.170473 Transcript_96233/m.170473 type:complete len:212 (+) Transcript_96233:605-1240(+)